MFNNKLEEKIDKLVKEVDNLIKEVNEIKGMLPDKIVSDAGDTFKTTEGLYHYSHRKGKITE